MSDTHTPALPTDNMTTADASATYAWVVPTFKVSGVFSSHMVLQREQPIRLWGFSDTPGSLVKGQFMGEIVTATVDDDYRFTLTFTARNATREPQKMTISDDRDHMVTFDDVLVGDVWLIGGQSNAELHVEPCMTLTPSVEFDENDPFRLFAQSQAYAWSRPDLTPMPAPDVIHPDWCWKCPDREASLEFSAMGWYFARELMKYTDVPQGLIMMAAGGACIRELLPMELAHGEGYFSGGNVCEGGYYNTLIHPFLGLSFRAMLFFQGESEGGDRTLAEKYAYDLTLLVTDERARFGRPFPFYNVQLSDYRDEGTVIFPYHDIVRIQQYRALSLISDSTLTVDMDLGSPDDYPDWAHSPRKLELGERLALLVLAKEYGVNRISESASPRPVTATANSEGTAVTIEFTDISAGLIVAGHTPADSYGMEVQGFSIGDYDHRTPAHAVVSSRHSVTVNLPEGMKMSDLPAEQRMINYAYFLRVTPENADLRGGNNLPAPAFSLPVFGV